MPSIPGGARFLSIATPLLALPSSFLGAHYLHNIDVAFATGYSGRRA